MEKGVEVIGTLTSHVFDIRGLETGPTVDYSKS